MANRQCDKMSRLEFVAIQFGVKFVIYKLRHYVDRVCQQYLHYLFYFENFVDFYKLFHDFTIILFIFKVILYYTILWILSLGKPSWIGRKSAAFLLADQIWVDGVAISHSLIHLKPSST